MLMQQILAHTSSPLSAGLHLGRDADRRQHGFSGLRWSVVHRQQDHGLASSANRRNATSRLLTAARSRPDRSRASTCRLQAVRDGAADPAIMRARAEGAPPRPCSIARRPPRALAVSSSSTRTVELSLALNGSTNDGARSGGPRLFPASIASRPVDIGLYISRPFRSRHERWRMAALACLAPHQPPGWILPRRCRGRCAACLDKRPCSAESISASDGDGQLASRRRNLFIVGNDGLTDGHRQQPAARRASSRKILLKRRPGFSSARRRPTVSNAFTRTAGSPSFRCASPSVAPLRRWRRVLVATRR